MGAMASILKRALPKRLVNELQFRRHRARREGAANRGTAAAFSAVYAQRAWGDDGSVFYSGPGSAESTVTDAYVRMLADRFDAMPERPRVLDLGCGDFRVARRLIPHVASYTGIDVVPELVDYNQAHFGSDRVRFVCADVAADDLPVADVVLVREVLQHLSNAQVAAVLAKLRAYPAAFVTTPEPADGIVAHPNRDLVPGPDTRSVFGSALLLDRPPFEVKAEIVLSVPIAEQGLDAWTMVTRRLA